MSTSLREQMKQILPELLPARPQDAIKGTELIRLVKFRLDNKEYSDATIRYHFSILSHDPTSPIAKVEQGQGYYLRPTAFIGTSQPEEYRRLIQGQLGEEPVSAAQIDRARRNLLKFQTILSRSFLAESRSLFLTESMASDDSLPRHWKLSDAIVVTWNTALESASDVSSKRQHLLDPGELMLRRSLGAPQYQLHATNLLLQTDLKNCHEAFFRLLSCGSWAHASELLIASPISDGRLAKELRTLAGQFGIGVTSFGIDLGRLDDLPSTEEIRSMNEPEFSGVESILQPQTLATPTVRAHLDWPLVQELKQDYPPISKLFDWVAECLTAGEVYPPKG
ncbi:MAG: hypothetical protein AAF555_00595 [Verrucomicrobiota bacterium]